MRLHRFDYDTLRRSSNWLHRFDYDTKCTLWILLHRFDYDTLNESDSQGYIGLIMIQICIQFKWLHRFDYDTNKKITHTVT